MFLLFSMVTTYSRALSCTNIAARNLPSFIAWKTNNVRNWHNRKLAWYRTMVIYRTAETYKKYVEYTRSGIIGQENGNWTMAKIKPGIEVLLHCTNCLVHLSKVNVLRKRVHEWISKYKFTDFQIIIPYNSNHYKRENTFLLYLYQIAYIHYPLER